MGSMLVERPVEWWERRAAAEPEGELVTAGRIGSGSPYVDQVWRAFVEEAIAIGLYVPPEGVTVDDIVAATERAPVYSAPARSKVRDQDLPAVGSFG